jgi:hypothetical protein
LPAEHHFVAVNYSASSLLDRLSPAPVHTFGQSLPAGLAIPLLECRRRDFSLHQEFRELSPLRLTLERHASVFKRERWCRAKTSTAIGSQVSHHTVRAGSALSAVREVGGSPLGNGPLLRHQQTTVSRRYVEHLIDLMTAQVNAIDGVGEFPSESNPHD